MTNRQKEELRLCIERYSKEWPRFDSEVIKEMFISPRNDFNNCSYLYFIKSGLFHKVLNHIDEAHENKTSNS